MRPSRGPRAAQEIPKDLQNAMQKSAQKNPQKYLLGRKCLKPAISLWIKIGPHFRTQICTFFNHVLHMFFTTFSKKVETHFGTQFGIRAAQEGQDEPKRTIRSFKEPKTFIYENHKKHLFFQGFWLQRPLKKASRGPRWLPKGTQKIQDPKKLESRVETRNYKKDWNQFWSPLWNPSTAKK